MPQTSCTGLLAALSILLSSAAPALAADASQFVSQYRQAEPRIEAAYGDVKINAVYRQYDHERVLFENDLSINIDGGKFSQVSIARQDTPLDASTVSPAGLLTVTLGKPDLLLVASKAPDAADFTFSRYDTHPSAANLNIFERSSLQTATAPYCLQETRLIDLLSLPTWKLQAVKEVQSGGKAVVNLTFANTGPNSQLHPQSIDVVLDPKDWCIIDYTIALSQRILHGHVEYFDTDSFPRRVKSTETWAEVPGANEHLNQARTETTSYEFTTPPPVCFTLAGLGVNTLPPPNTMK